MARQRNKNWILLFLFFQGFSVYSQTPVPEREVPGENVSAPLPVDFFPGRFSWKRILETSWDFLQNLDRQFLLSLLESLGLFLLFLFLLFRISRILARREEWIAARTFPPLRFRNTLILDEATLRNGLHRLIHMVRLLLAPLAFISWWSLTLILFPDLRGFGFLIFLRGIFLTLLTGFLASWFLVATNNTFRVLMANIETWKGGLIRPVRISSAELITEIQLTLLLRNLLTGLRIFTLTFLSYLLLPVVFSYFEFTREWAVVLLGYVIDPVRSLLAGIVGYLPNLFFILVTVFVVKYIIRFVKVFFDATASQRVSIQGFRHEWSDPTYKILRFLIIVFTLIVVFPYLPGSDSEAFKGVSIFIGVLFSLGSSSAIANAVAGTILTYMYPFRVGDRVKIGEATGDVLEMTLLVTRIRTIKNVVVTIPNSMVMGSQIINYSSDSIREPLILSTTVTLGYDVPWREVHRVLIESALKTAGILDKPSPFVLQTSLGDFSIAYELNASTGEPHRMARIYSDLHASILDGCQEAGIEILSPVFNAIRDGSESTVTIKEPPANAPRARKGSRP